MSETPQVSVEFARDEAYAKEFQTNLGIMDAWARGETVAQIAAAHQGKCEAVVAATINKVTSNVGLPDVALSETRWDKLEEHFGKVELEVSLLTGDGVDGRAKIDKNLEIAQQVCQWS
jgi:hypothetical protein